MVFVVAASFADHAQRDAGQVPFQQHGAQQEHGEGEVILVLISFQTDPKAVLPLRFRGGDFVNELINVLPALFFPENSVLVGVEVTVAVLSHGEIAKIDGIGEIFLGQGVDSAKDLRFAAEVFPIDLKGYIAPAAVGIYMGKDPLVQIGSQVGQNLGGILGSKAKFPEHIRIGAAAQEVIGQAVYNFFYHGFLLIFPREFILCES